MERAPHARPTLSTARLPKPMATPAAGVNPFAILTDACRGEGCSTWRRPGWLGGGESGFDAFDAFAAAVHAASRPLMLPLGDAIPLSIVPDAVAFESDGVSFEMDRVRGTVSVDVRWRMAGRPYPLSEYELGGGSDDIPLSLFAKAVPKFRDIDRRFFVLTDDAGLARSRRAIETSDAVPDAFL